MRLEGGQVCCAKEFGDLGCGEARQQAPATSTGNPKPRSSTKLQSVAAVICSTGGVFHGTRHAPLHPPAAAAAAAAAPSVALAAAVLEFWATHGCLQRCSGVTTQSADRRVDREAEQAAPSCVPEQRVD